MKIKDLKLSIKWLLMADRLKPYINETKRFISRTFHLEKAKNPFVLSLVRSHNLGTQNVHTSNVELVCS